MKISGILILSLLLALVACDGASDKGTGTMNTINLSEWERKMHVTFPEDTRALGLRVEPGMDDAAYLKVRMPVRAWEKFLEGSPVDPQDLDTAKRFFLGDDDDWWDPGKPAELPTAQANLPDGSVLNLGVDLSGATEATVYLMWHQR